MKIYLASAWSRKEEMQGIANQLTAMGHEITSRWLFNEKDQSTLVPLSKDAVASQFESVAREALHQEHALHDVEDVLRADCLIRFSDADEMAFPLVASKLCSGARHFEMGLAYLWGKLAEFYANEMPNSEIIVKPNIIFVVGGKQNIFDRLPEIMHVENTSKMLNIMRRAAILEGILYDEYAFTEADEWAEKLGKEKRYD